MIDLEEQFNFTNKRKHPTNQTKAVYRFYDRAQAETFTELLVDAGIDFEAQIDDDDPRMPTYFGVARIHEKKVDILNYTAIGKHRKPFIAASPMRWIIIGISLLVLFLAFLGAWKSST